MEKKNYEQSKKLDNVCYDIRGPVMDEAMRMEARGANILKLNIGNPAPFGFYAPDEVILDMIYNLRNCEGYSDSRGLFSRPQGDHAVLPAQGHSECRHQRHLYRQRRE